MLTWQHHRDRGQQNDVRTLAGLDRAGQGVVAIGRLGHEVAANIIRMTTNVNAPGALYWAAPARRRRGRPTRDRRPSAHPVVRSRAPADGGNFTDGWVAWSAVMLSNVNVL